jgi:hypothetical protein
MVVKGWPRYVLEARNSSTEQTTRITEVCKFEVNIEDMPYTIVPGRLGGRRKLYRRNMQHFTELLKYRCSNYTLSLKYE